MIRDLAYMFIQSKRDPGFSTLCKIIYSLGLIAVLTASRSISYSLYYLYPAMILSLELAVLSWLKGYRTVVNGLKLIVVFTLLGAIISYLAVLAGMPAIPPSEMVTGAVRLVAFFLAFTQLFQLLSVDEWRCILAALGLRDQAVILTLLLSQLPLTLVYFSEALVTISLKYRGRRMGALVTPLIYHTALLTRSRLEALLQYPVKPSYSGLTLFRVKDIYLYIMLALLVLPLIPGFTV
ncbi:hypothetical protein [Desulfurococcus amylolyticus]|uniref:Cobalt transport protein n=1 Tax=Desulfurococcus amylolyticus (strain DSM 18924 / JCM 16383 / VKM B-2413 / 1221n) TaxID=490899 RepID=B8D2K5_DESA1|nr:hypothetical protein [Desulfurococcus amylolyticus]ACL10593.1 hypothetical protein DKAM_0267 [Desulfurococcus amylolyticus 1221n]